MLEGLTLEQWSAPSLCTEWTVEQTVAHLSAGASTTTVGWIASMVRAGFDTDKHNARLLTRYLGEDWRGTLNRYLGTLSLRVSPTKDYPAFLGEVIVHGQDIARPLGIELAPDQSAVAEVAEFFAVKDLAVNSSTLVKGLRLEADDARFDAGSGLLVRGKLLDLVMVMAGRPALLDTLDGDGVAELRHRLS